MTRLEDRPDIPRGVQSPQDLESAERGKVEHQVSVDASNAGYPEPGQAGVRQRVGCPHAGRSGQGGKRRFGGDAEAVCRIRVPLADVRVANGQVDAGLRRLEDHRPIHRAGRAFRAAISRCPSRSISSQSSEVIGVEGPGLPIVPSDVDTCSRDLCDRCRSRVTVAERGSPGISIGWSSGPSSSTSCDESGSWVTRPTAIDRRIHSSRPRPPGPAPALHWASSS